MDAAAGGATIQNQENILVWAKCKIALPFGFCDIQALRELCRR